MKFCSVYIVLLSTLAFVAPLRAAIDPSELDAAIENGKKYLYAQQKDGKWEKDFEHHGDQKTGQSALVVHALLSAGENHQDQRLAKALEFIKKTPTQGVYALGVRCQLWNELPQSADVKTAMAHDAKLLLNGIQRTGKIQGFYNYNVGEGKAWSLSRAHYAALGVWSAALAGVEVPNTYWQFVEKSWIEQQDPSGGWSYKGKDYKQKEDEDYQVTPGVTADGIFTLFITQDFLHADEAISPRGNQKNPAIDKAIGWLSKNFDMVAKDQRYARDYPLVTLYAIERVGTASGYKYFNNVDWFQLGVERLLRNQRKDGSWKGDGGVGSDVSGTAFALLFLSRGRAPIMLNKLDYSLEAEKGKNKVETNWNQRPRDAANLTRWLSKQIERDLNWQIVNLSAQSSDLHDAPILYIAGNQNLKFSDDDLNKLRSFVEEGGLILGNADATSGAFVSSFKKLGSTLFPSYEFRQLPLDHVILKGEQYPVEKMKRKPAVLSLGNGAREFMLLVPDIDLSRSWQIMETRSREELFQLAANIFLYAVDKIEAQARGQTYIVKPNSRIKPSQTLNLARIKYEGNWNPEPGGWNRMAAILNNSDKVELKVSVVDPGKDSFGDCKVAHLTGCGRFKLTDEQRAGLKKFVEGGGTLITDSTGGNADAAAVIESELGTIFGAGVTEELKSPLPADNPIYQINGKKMDPVQYRLFAKERIVGELKSPRVRGAKVGGRLAIFYSAEDLSVGLVGQPVDGVLGYKPVSATAIMRGMLLNTLKK